MKISKLTRRPHSEYGSLSRRRVVKYMEEHPDEVFIQYDEELAAALGYKPSTVAVSIWELYRVGSIARERIDRKYYYGSFRAVEALRREMASRSSSRKGMIPEEAFQLARQNQERIRARVGEIDVLALLDRSRAQH